METVNVVIDSDQIELLAMVIFSCALAVCFCIGWLCNESGAK